MNKLLTCLISLSLLVGAPGVEAAGTVHGTQAVHAAKAKSKAKAKAGKAKVKHKKAVKPSSRSAQRLSAKKRASASPRVHRQTAPASALRMSSQLHSVSTPAPAADAPDLRSAAALVVDQKTGEFLFAKNPDMTTPIASITKLMTAMVVLDAGLSLSEQITINSDDVDRLKHTGSRLPLGVTLSREELIYLALVASENRAAAALSRAYPGGRSAFVRAMNQKAEELGMAHTWFVDGTGLSSSNRSTAADLARLVEAASDYPRIREIGSTGSYGVSVPGKRVVRIRDNGKVRRVTREVTRRLAFSNTNALTRNPGWDIGVSKTGFINEAGHCLVMQARINGRKVIMVLLDSAGKHSRIGDAARVRAWLESGASGGRFASQQYGSGAG